jgi:hypothetical protein
VGHDSQVFRAGEKTMSQQVIEGTWEEIESHKAELIGRHLRVIVTAERPTKRKPDVQVEAKIQPKQLRAYGMLKGILSSEDYFREKREDTEREDRSLR